jgi:DivIVA domain-containing protein
MIWVLAGLVVAAMAAVVVVASGRGGGFEEAEYDRPGPVVGSGGPIGAADLRRARFSVVLRGYRMSEVDALLERLADQLSDADESRRAAPARDGAADEPLGS